MKNAYHIELQLSTVCLQHVVHVPQIRSTIHRPRNHGFPLFVSSTHTSSRPTKAPTVIFPTTNLNKNGEMGHPHRTTLVGSHELDDSRYTVMRSKVRGDNARDSFTNCSGTSFREGYQTALFSQLSRKRLLIAGKLRLPSDGVCWAFWMISDRWKYGPCNLDLW